MHFSDTFVSQLGSNHKNAWDWEVLFTSIAWAENVKGHWNYWKGRYMLAWKRGKHANIFFFWLSVVVFFFPRLQGLGENVCHPFFTCAFFFFFFWVEISSRTLIPLFMSGSVHSGSASWDNWQVACELFPNSFPRYAWTSAWSSHSNFVGSKVYKCLGATRHLHFQQNDQGLLCATAVTQGWNGHRIRVSTQS